MRLKDSRWKQPRVLHFQTSNSKRKDNNYSIDTKFMVGRLHPRPMIPSLSRVPKARHLHQRYSRHFHHLSRLLYSVSYQPHLWLTTELPSGPTHPPHASLPLVRFWWPWPLDATTPLRRPSCDSAHPHFPRHWREGPRGQLDPAARPSGAGCGPRPGQPSRQTGNHALGAG